MPDRPTIQFAPIDSHEIKIPPGYRVVVNLIPIDVAETRGSAADESQCMCDIIATLAEGRKRLTTAKLLTALEARDCVWGEATVKRKLAASVRAGRITSRDDVDPPGYGLPQWG